MLKIGYLWIVVQCSLISLSSLKINSLIYFMVSEINILTKFLSTICYTVIINYASFEKMHGFPMNMHRKIIFRIKCKLTFYPWSIRISSLTPCVMWSCTGNFLIRARIVTYD